MLIQFRLLWLLISWTEVWLAVNMILLGKNQWFTRMEKHKNLIVKLSHPAVPACQQVSGFSVQNVLHNTALQDRWSSDHSWRARSSINHFTALRITQSVLPVQKEPNELQWRQSCKLTVFRPYLSDMFPHREELIIIPINTACSDKERGTITTDSLRAYTFSEQALEKHYRCEQRHLQAEESPFAVELWG